MNLHRLMKWTAALLLISGLEGVAAVANLAQSAPPEPQPEAKGVVGENRHRVTFKGGAAIEVVGVSTIPTGAHTWWKPDGSLLAEAPVDTIQRQTGEAGEARVILLRVSGVKPDDNFRWAPVSSLRTWGGRTTKHGQRTPELEYYEATFSRDNSDCEVAARLAVGDWKTEVSNDGRGGTGMFVNGHKFAFGKARSFKFRGLSMTVFAVAHNFFGQDRRLVAVDLAGKLRPAVHYSAGSDGDDKWVIDLIDGEFPLPPEQIKEYQVQFRPFEPAAIKGIALNPRSASKPAVKVPKKNESYDLRVERRADANGASAPSPPSDGDFQALHKYLSDPRKRLFAGNGEPDADWNARRAFTYSIRTIIRVMPPYNLEAMNDDYQDVRVRKETKDFVELEVISYPLNTNAEAMVENRDWRRDYAAMKEYLKPGVTTNWDAAMQKDLLADLARSGINPDKLSDQQVVAQVSRWLLDRCQYRSMAFGTMYADFPGNKPVIFPGLEKAFERETGDPTWTVQEEFDHELFGKGMFYHRCRGSCTSSSVLMATVLRALGIPTRIIEMIPIVDQNDPEQVAMVKTNLRHDRVRTTIVNGLLRLGRGFANHTYNEVFVGNRWRRLNYAKLGQNILDEQYFGLMIHVHTFNDLSEARFAPTWGRRYALGVHDEVFQYGNPYRALEISDLFGRDSRVPTSPLEEHKTLTITKAYWLESKDTAEMIRQGARRPKEGEGHVYIHADEWLPGQGKDQYLTFLNQVDRSLVFRAEGHPDVKGQVQPSFWVDDRSGLREILLIVPRDQYAKMARGVTYTIHPVHAVGGYEWKVKDGVTITREASLEEKLDGVIERVDKLEKRLQEIERQKAKSEQRGN